MKASYVKPPTHRFAAAVAILTAMAATSAAGQQTPTSATPLPPYRPPALALVQPAAGGSVPQDRPVVVFRFVSVEPNDAIDLRSFAVSVDGEDRTALFQVAVGEAWGPIASPSQEANNLSLGLHHVAARICSSRGACTETAVSVSVVSAVVPSDAHAENTRASRRRKLIDALLAVTRKLLTP